MNHATEFMPVECLCIPKALFFDKRYENLSVDARVLYSLLLDRKEMAVRNGWIDRYGAVYVLYSREEMEKHLNAPSIRVERALAQLEAHDQMVAVARPYKGRADQIYVRDITADQIIEQEEENMGKKNTKRKNLLHPNLSLHSRIPLSNQPFPASLPSPDARSHLCPASASSLTPEFLPAFLLS